MKSTWNFSKLADIKKKKRLRLLEIGAKAGLCESQISRALKHGVATEECASRLAKAFGVSLKSLRLPNSTEAA